MQQGASHVKVIAIPVQRPPDRDVDQQPAHRDREREAGIEWMRRPEAIDRLKHNPAQQPKIGQCVDEGGQRLRPLIAERESRVWRPTRDPLRPPGKPQRKRIGEHMQAIGRKRQRAADETNSNFERAEAQNDQTGDAQSS